MRPSEFRDIELWFQMSPYEFFRIVYDGTDGYSHMMEVLIDSKTKLRDEHGHGECMSRLNGETRRDLLRLWMRWDGKSGKILDGDDMSELIRDLVPICHRYNNVIICDGEYEMTFDDIKDFSKRKLRIRGTRNVGPVGYYRPELLPVYEKRLEEDSENLEGMKRRLIAGLEANDFGVVASLSPKVVELMRRTETYGRYVRELKDAIGYMGELG